MVEFKHPANVVANRKPSGSRSRSASNWFTIPCRPRAALSIVLNVISVSGPLLWP